MAQLHLQTPSGRPRARALGVPFCGTPGRLNAIMDVPGVHVGYVTLIDGEGPLAIGEGPVRTGVTAILPRSHGDLLTPAFAGYFSLNGNGELTGAHLINEVGQVGGPITITNTHSCGIARDASVQWMGTHFPDDLADTFSLPVAAETYDGFLNDINGFHVRAEHVMAAIDGAATCSVEEGAVGGGTGMIAFGFKAGSGTASRLVDHHAEQVTIGAFVQANFGDRRTLTMRGRPLGLSLPEPAMRRGEAERGGSSIIGIVATDAPLLPHQLSRLARRAALGMARTGGMANHTSGDLFLAFSTANRAALAPGVTGHAALRFIPDSRELNTLFEATIEAIEEAILNSLVAATEMTGRDGHFVPALPHDAVRDLFAR